MNSAIIIFIIMIFSIAIFFIITAITFNITVGAICYPSQNALITNNCRKYELNGEYKTYSLGVEGAVTQYYAHYNNKTIEIIKEVQP